MPSKDVDQSTKGSLFLLGLLMPSFLGMKISTRLLAKFVFGAVLPRALLAEHMPRMNS